MKKFKFGLDKVLGHRKTLENLAQSEYQAALADLKREERTLEAMIRTKNSIFHGIYGDTEYDDANRLNYLKHTHVFLGLHDQRIKAQELRVQEFHRLVESKREILRKCAIESRILEKLKDKHMEDHRVDFEKEQQLLLDELTLLRWPREEDRESE